MLHCSVGRAEFIQMEELAETTEQIPATNPFHTSEKRERNGRGGPTQTGFGKLEAVGWNFQLFLFFSHSFWGACSPQKSRTLNSAGSVSHRKKAVRSQSQNKHCFQHHQQFPWSLGFGWGITEVPLPAPPKFYAVGIPLACLSVACA